MGPDLPLRVLFIVPYAPTRIRTRPHHFIRALASAGHDVTIATLWSSEEDRAALEDFVRQGIPVIAERLPAGRSLVNCLRAVAGSEPLQAHFSWHPRLARRLGQVVQQAPLDVVHTEHLRGVRYGLAASLGPATNGSTRPAMVWDSVDCISSLFRRASRHSSTRRVRLAARLELSRTERYEALVVDRFDRVLVTSETDRRELLELARTRRDASRPPRVEVVPNGVDLGHFSPTSEPREPLTLVISGKMSYHANATAVSHFVREVMPRVWSELPAVRLWVVGKDPTREVLRLGRLWKDAVGTGPDDGDRRSRVLITGTVEDVRPFLRRAALSVAPIQYGVGIQNKILEAMACGIPVLATPQAVAGVGAKQGQDLAVASTPGELAATVVSLLKQPAERARLGLAGRMFVERHHDWQGLGRRLAEIYGSARAGESLAG